MNLAVKRTLVVLLLTVVYFSPPSVLALANPAATSCVDSGGDYQIVKNSNGSEDGKCVYFGKFECSDLEYFKGDGCATQRMIFGSLNSLPVKLTLGAVVISVAFLAWKRFKKPPQIKNPTL